MQPNETNPLQGHTVIGTFTETWDAESAIEDLKFAGFDGFLRYVQHEDNGLSDSTKSRGGFHDYFARIYGFEDQSEYQDSRNNFSVNPQAEDFFNEVFEKKLHVILVQASDTIDKAIDIIRVNHGKVEVKHWAFFAAMRDEPHKIPGETYQQTPRIHPTQAVEPPVDTAL